MVCVVVSSSATASDSKVVISRNRAVMAGNIRILVIIGESRQEFCYHGTVVHTHVVSVELKNTPYWFKFVSATSFSSTAESAISSSWALIITATHAIKSIQNKEFIFVFSNWEYKSLV